jgi:hypothetical protein
VTSYYENATATDIVKLIVDTYTSGFTRVNVQEGLGTIDFLPCASPPDTPTRTLRRIANKIGGAFYIDAFKDLHFFGSSGETGIARADGAADADEQRLASLKSRSATNSTSSSSARACRWKPRADRRWRMSRPGRRRFRWKTRATSLLTTGVALIDEYGVIAFTFISSLSAGDDGEDGGGGGRGRSSSTTSASSWASASAWRRG